MSDHERPREYIDSDPNAKADDENDSDAGATTSVPIPATGDWLGTWGHALPLFLQYGGDFSRETRKQYDWSVRQFFRHPALATLRLDELTPDLLVQYRQYLFTRTQPGFRIFDPAGRSRRSAEPQGQEPLNALTVWAPPARGRKSERGPGALSSASVNVRLVAMRSFLQFCRKRGWLAPGFDHDTIEDALQGVKVQPTASHDILQEHEWAEFRSAALAPLRGDGSAIKTRGGNTGAWTALRDAGIVALFVTTGLRRSELINLNVGDFERTRRADGTEEWHVTLQSHQTKGGYGAGTVPVALDVIADLSDYLTETGRTWRDRATPLFLSWHPQSGGGTGRLNPHSINIVINRVNQQFIADRRAAGDDLENRNIHPHSTRASAAVALMRGNPAKGRAKAGLHDTQRFLRHSNPNTTDIYLRGLDVGEQLRPFALSIDGSAPSAPSARSTTPPAEPEEEESPASGDEG